MTAAPSLDLHLQAFLLDDGGEFPGLGIDEEDEEKYKKLVAMIPEDDEGIEDQIEDITESFLEAAGEVIF